MRWAKDTAGVLRAIGMDAEVGRQLERYLDRALGKPKASIEVTRKTEPDPAAIEAEPVRLIGEHPALARDIEIQDASGRLIEAAADGGADTRVPVQNTAASAADSTAGQA